MDDESTHGCGCDPFPTELGDSLSSSLDSQETSESSRHPLILHPSLVPHPDFQCQHILPEEASFRHSGWLSFRKAVFDAFEALHIGANRMDRFCNCGSGCVAEYSPSQDRYRVSANYCHDRFCVPCMTARSKLVERNLLDLCEGRSLKFITLTLRHSPTPLADQIKRLSASFVTLRQSQLWKTNVRGGVSVFELKVGKDQLWHPHLHILCEASFIDQAELSAKWHAITGDSYIVDIRRAKDNNEAIGYVCKYAAKPLDSSLFKDHSRLCEAITALAGKRLFNTFGSWRGWKLDDRDVNDPGDWKRVCPIAQLVAATQRHERWADVLMARLLNLPAPPPTG